MKLLKTAITQTCMGIVGWNSVFDTTQWQGKLSRFSKESGPDNLAGISAMMW
jgi:hypothetical protein